jgi:hypothetical protein
MAELKRKEEELTTAELARDGNPSKQPEGPKLVKGQELETLDKAIEASEPSHADRRSQLVEQARPCREGGHERAQREAGRE